MRNNFFQSIPTQKLWGLVLFALLSLPTVSWGQVATNSGSGLNPTYTSLAAAITALNGVAITSPVIITLTGNETAPVGGYSITQTGGTSTNTIIIQGSTSTITAFTPQASGVFTDAIFKIIGSDFVTIQNFTMQENASNSTTAAATNNMTEFGVALLYASLTNGAQNNTIQNNTISLNRTYSNTFGIYSNTRHSATAVGTLAEVTNPTGSNSRNKVYTNAISNVNMGITFIGSGTAVNQDSGNDIGGSSLSTANTITNWGGAAAISSYISNTGTSYCIFVNNQVGENVSYNTITSATISGTPVTLRGILKDYSTAPIGTFSSTISNNTIIISDNFISGTLECIRSQGMTTLSTATINVNGNTILNTSMGGLSSSTTIVGIVNSSAPGTLNINSNIIRGTTSTATTGGFTGISNTGIVVTATNITNNQIGNASGNAITFSVATLGAVTSITNTGGAATCALSIQNNDIRGITHSVAGSSVHTYITNTAATLSQNISSNTFTNLNVNTTGSVTFVNNAVNVPATGSMNVNTNSIVTAFNKGGAGGTITFYSSNASSVTGSVINFQNNNFSNITVTGLTGFVGINNTDGGSPTKTITGNTFNNISGGTGAINPMTVNFFGGTTSTVSSNTITNISWGTAITALTIGGSNTATTLNINSNIVNTISTTTGAVVGISNATVALCNMSNNLINTLSSTASGTNIGISYSGTSTCNIFKNKIYDLSGSNAGSTVNGILVSAGTTINIYNNLIGDLRTPAANAANPLIGISITGGTTSNVYYNTVFLNGSSSGALFGSSAISVSTTPTVTLRNNIFVNSSTTMGVGLAVAYRRSSATLTPYVAASNNNLFFASTIYTDGTTPQVTLANYQTLVSTRDALSVSELPTWQSTAGANANFLKYSASLASLADGAGAFITGFTDDYAGTTRSATTPDMGAWEIDLIPILTIADNGTQPAAGNINQGSTSNILQSFTITEGNRANATLNTLTIPTGGTYVAADIQALGFKLWRSTTNTFGSATAFTGVTATAAGSGETVTFSSLALGITKNTVVYFWVTTDISASATALNTVNANALAPANVVFALGTPTGTVSAGGLQTIQTATPVISLASGGAPVANPTQGTNNVVLYRVDVTVATTAATLNAIQFATAGTYMASDLTNLKIWYNTSNTFAGATQIGSTKITSLGAGTQAFTGLAQAFAIGTNYVFLTTDVPCLATVSNTISVNAIPDIDATFVTGTFGANTAAASGTVTLNATTLNNATAVIPTVGNTQVSLAWTNPTGCVDEIMIVVAPATNSGTPSGDGTAYTANLTYGSGTALGNGFVAYKGSASPQVIISLTNYTTYYFKIFTRSGTSWSSGIEVNATPIPTYCGAPLTSTVNAIDIVTNVLLTNAILATYNNPSASVAPNYVIYNNTPLNLERGTNNSIAITFGTDGTQHSAVWIDYNQNGVYEASENIAISSLAAGASATVTYNFVIPMSANVGNTRMRVRGGSDVVYTTGGACATILYGETEDYLVNITPTSPQTLGTIASVQATPATTNKNTANNPILRIDLPTTGALGTLTLTNLVVTSANISDADIATNGVKLYYTTTTVFSTATPVGTGQSFASGTATFSSLTRLLANGNNYIWVTYDVATTATVGNTLDAQIAIGNITIAEAGGATATGSIPVSALNPAGSTLIIPRAPQALTATAFSTSQINLATSVNADSDNIMVAWNSVNTFGVPTGTYTPGNSITGGGTVWYVGTVAGLANHTGLTANTQYFYSVWTVGGSTYSATAQTVNATTLANPLNYVFSQSNGTYTAIAPATILFTNQDDVVSASQTIPSFTYNGVAYTNMFVSTNGFLKLGAATGPGSVIYTPLSSSSTALQNTISAFSADLDGIDATSVVGWSTVGNEVIVQWSNVRRFGLAGESVNFQIRLNTVTNQINIVYGTFASGTSANTMQVGIRGFDETWRIQISNRQNNLDWDKTTMGTANTSALPMTTTNLPVSGLTFTYSPNNCTLFPLIGAVTQTGTDVTVNWTAQAEAANGYDVRYRLQSAGIGTYTTVNVVGQASNSVVIPSLPSGVYVFEVRTRCSAGTFSDYSNAVVFTVAGNYYLIAGGNTNVLTDWGSNTNGTGSNPPALNITATIWNVRNNATVTNSFAWTLGIGAKIIVGDGIITTNFILPIGSNVIGTIDVANLGTLTLQNTTNPTLGTLAVGSTVDYNGTGAQTITVANYSNLTISGARIASPVITLASGTIGVGNNFSVTATGVGSYTNTGNTVNFSSVGMQTIPAFTYRNITNTGNGNRTLASSGEVNIAGTFIPGTGVYTVTGSTVNYSATTGGPLTMASFNYNNLIFSGTQTFSIGLGNTINVAGDMTVSSVGSGIFNVNNTTGTTTLTIGNDLIISGAGTTLFRVISNGSALNTTVNVGRDLNLSGSGRINMESASSTNGVAVVNVGRDFISTATSVASGGSNGVLDWGTGTITSNAINITRNFDKSGVGSFGTTSSTNSATGFVFNGTAQTFSYAGATSFYMQYVINSGSTLQMNSNLALLGLTNPRSIFTVNSGGILDLNTRVISSASSVDPTFTLASGATVKTAHASGLAGNFTGFLGTLTLNSTANYEFNGISAQVTSAFVTMPTANTVNNLTINNSTGVTLTNSIVVSSVLNLTSGKLTTGSNILTLQPGASSVNPVLGKIDSFVEGNVSITSNADGDVLLFPMGGGTWWGPTRLVTNGGTANATNFAVKYNNVSSPLNSLPLPTMPEVITNVLQAYWDIDRTGGRSADVQLYWNNNLGQITDRTQLRVLHGIVSGWENYGVDNTNGNTSDGTAGSNAQGSIIKTGVSVFSPFSIGSISIVNPLPLTLVGFNAIRKNSENVQVTWQTINEIDLKYFAIEKSADAKNFTEVGRMNAQTATTDLKNYQFNDNEKGSVYYRLRFIHYNSADEWSVVRFVSGGTPSKDEKILVYPNPLQQEVSFGIPTAFKGKNVAIKITNAESKLIAEYIGTWEEVATQISQAHTNWAKGMYLWYITPAGEKAQVIKVMK